MSFRKRLRTLGVRDLTFPLCVTALVLGTTLFRQSPLRDAVTHAEAHGVSLHVGREMAVIAPLAGLFDMWALLTVPQHIALVATLLLVVGAWRSLVVVRSGTVPVWWREAVRFCLVTVALAVLLVINVLVPRPMASLHIDDPEVVAVDVHAHTASSRDARADWTPQRVREWHRAAGFHVAYVTDHKRFGGAVDALAMNPARAGDGVVLLPGLELYSGGQHVNVLSMTAVDSAHVVDGDHLKRSMRLADGRTPLILQTIPFRLSGFAGPAQDSLARTTALEINDGAPKGLTFGLVHHAELVRLADSLNLALVAGSDNHGWGNTASGWTLVRVPGWRELAPLALAVRLEETLATGRNATRVIERRTPLLLSSASAVFIAPAVLVGVMRGLTPPERLSWVAWAWSTVLFRLGLRRAAHGALARARHKRFASRRKRRVAQILPAMDMQS